MRPAPGDLISGKYRLLRLIGDGGMGSVYEARHEFLGTAVALKFLHPELARRQGLVARFLQEARVAASIHSPHIAHVTDVDQSAEGAAYLVMELLQGESLQAVLDRQRKLPRDTTLDYVFQMLSGLEAAHAIGVVHRDLKPDNVFVVAATRGPCVKLLDFGIAKLRTSREFQTGLTRPGVVMGTPEYMAPEQAFSADCVDPRADLYAIGVMVFEMLSGARPVDGDDAREIAARVMAQKVTYLRQLDPSIPEQLAQIVHRAMAPNPAHRFASAAELRDALMPFSGALSFAGQMATTPAPPQVAQRTGFGATAPVSPRQSASPVGGQRARAPSASPPSVAVQSPLASTAKDPGGIGPLAASLAATTPHQPIQARPKDDGGSAGQPPLGTRPFGSGGEERMAHADASRAAASRVGSQGGSAQQARPVEVGGTTAPMQPLPAYAQGGAPQPRLASQAAPEGKTQFGTMQVPQAIQQQTEQIPAYAAQAAAFTPSPAAAYGQPVSLYGSAHPSAYSQGSAVYTPQPPYSALPSNAGTSPPTRARGPRGLSIGVIGAMAGAVGVILVVGVMALQPSDEPAGSGGGPVALSFGATTPTTPPTVPTTPPPPPTFEQPTVVQPQSQAPQTTPTAKPPTTPRPRDAGTATRDASTLPGLSFPPFPFPIPSSLPPIPSTLPNLPPLPTAFPTVLPPFPFPFPGTASSGGS